MKNYILEIFCFGYNQYFLLLVLYYNNFYNGATFLCGNYSVVENNYITGTSNFAGHSNVTSNTLLDAITVKNNVRYHSNTQTGQITGGAWIGEVNPGSSSTDTNTPSSTDSGSGASSSSSDSGSDNTENANSTSE